MIRAAITVIVGIILAAAPITAAMVVTDQHPTNPIARPFGEGHRVAA